MRKIVFTLLGVLALSSMGCQTKGGESRINVEVTSMTPSQTIDLSSAFTSALSSYCNGSALVWSYPSGDALGAAYVPAIDGAVDQAGRFTAPACGSTLLGMIVTVQATCTMPSGQKAIATSNIAIAQEIIKSVEYAAAEVTINGIVCSANTPTSISIPGGSTIQYHAAVNTSCGTTYVPPLVSPAPPICDSSISP